MPHLTTSDWIWFVRFLYSLLLPLRSYSASWWFFQVVSSFWMWSHYVEKFPWCLLGCICLCYLMMPAEIPGRTVMGSGAVSAYLKRLYGVDKWAGILINAVLTCFLYTSAICRWCPLHSCGFSLSMHGEDGPSLVLWYVICSVLGAGLNMPLFSINGFAKLHLHWLGSQCSLKKWMHELRSLEWQLLIPDKHVDDEVDEQRSINWWKLLCQGCT